jgi:hypothetical protein
MRRRLAVTGAVLAAVVGEWIGHSLSYYRVAGLAGLQAGLVTGVHDYMVPLGVALLVGAAATATIWARAWLALGARLDRSAIRLGSLLRGRRAGAVGSQEAVLSADRTGSWSRRTSFGAHTFALAIPMALLQCSLYLAQENLERTAHGLPGGGLGPLVDGFGASAWIQAGVAVLMAATTVLAMRLLRSRAAAVERSERLVRALWRRAQRPVSSATPRPMHVTPAQLLLRSAVWVRPPPVPAAA